MKIIEKKAKIIWIAIGMAIIAVSVSVYFNGSRKNSGDELSTDQPSDKIAALVQGVDLQTVEEVITVHYRVEGLHERRRGDYFCMIFRHDDSWTDLVRASAPQGGFPSRYTYLLGVDRVQALAIKSHFPAGSVLTINASSNTPCEGSLILKRSHLSLSRRPLDYSSIAKLKGRIGDRQRIAIAL